MALQASITTEQTAAHEAGSDPHSAKIRLIYEEDKLLALRDEMQAKLGNSASRAPGIATDQARKLDAKADVVIDQDPKVAVEKIDQAIRYKRLAISDLDKLLHLPQRSAAFAVGSVYVINTNGSPCGAPSEGTCYRAKITFAKPASSFNIQLPAGYKLGGASCSPQGGAEGWAYSSPSASGFTCDRNGASATLNAAVDFQAMPGLTSEHPVEITAGACPKWCAELTGPPLGTGP